MYAIRSYYGARRLHLVDLNGAFAGKPVNEEAIKAIVEAVGNRITSYNVCYTKLLRCLSRTQ